MNFHAFTGNARKARNVNLSGQKTTNPFAHPTSWTQASSSGPLKSVAHAQAERQQRQQERDRLRAALCIQRVWRGHRVRRLLRDRRRQQLDELYKSTSWDKNTRVLEALPLALAVVQVTRADDRARLAVVVDDLLQTNFDCFQRREVPPTRLDELSRLLIAALDQSQASDANFQTETELFLRALLEIIRARTKSVDKVWRAYYKILGRYCQRAASDGDSRFPCWDIVQELIIAPLVTGQEVGPGAYHEFVVSFLTQPEMEFFERNAAMFSTKLDLEKLSRVVLAALVDEGALAGNRSSSLWLLAHFIALQRERKDHSLPSPYLRALYMQLSALSNYIRSSFSLQPEPRTQSEGQGTEDGPQSSPSPYVAEQLASLVNQKEISSLLDKFTANHSRTTAADFEDASLLAGYTLTLIHCFPKQSDDIRMRLYLADISTAQGRLPAVKFFWYAVGQTGVFSSIVSNEASTVPVLRREPSSVRPTTARDSPRWDREWRTVLLFLELYTFVLRLTDDDDFFSGLAVPLTGVSGSRLRSSGLSRDELKRLTLFLKHLGFNLYYNATQVLEAGWGVTKTRNSVPEVLAPFAQRSDSTSAGSDARKSATFGIVAGLGFGAFKGLVTSAVRMLYERDSRRQFLPEGHWLMTSKFDMEGFLSAVVLEEQRQHELRESGEDDGAGDGVDGEDEMDEEGYSALEGLDQRLSLQRLGQGWSRKAQLERFRARQKKTMRERMLASIAPKLEVLRNMPFVIPFETRVQIFRQFVHLDKERRRAGNIDPDQWRMWVLNQHGGMWDQRGRGRDILSRHHAEIKRGRVFPDAMKVFYDLGDGLKEPIQITFVDEFGMQEAGIDGGGVTKEFLTSVTKEAFSSEQGLFVANSKNSYYPNPCALDQQKEALRAVGVEQDSEPWRDSMTELLQQFEFLGRIIGKCMYEGILIDVVFAGFFLLKWAGSDTTYRANINDLLELDEELYQGMLQLKNYPGDVSELGLDFTINDQISLPDEPVRTVTRALIPGGEKVAVTNENRPLYISYVARHRLVVQPYAQTRAFLRGLGLMIDPAWLGMFNQNELQRLVGGDSREIDVEDLRAHTMYSGIYVVGNDGQEHPTIRLFWEVMHGLADSERREVLKFVTSTPRAPLLGFGQLRPPFSIRDGGNDEERLPSSSTCVNLLKLPVYRSADTLRQKLLYAVKSGAGFDLS